MPAITDKLRRGSPAFSTTLAADKASGAPSATLSSAGTVPTDTAVDFTVGRVDSNGNKTPATKAVYKATLSGSTISNLTLVEGTDQLHKAGTIVEITFTAATWNDMVTWGLTQHNQDGTHDPTKVGMLAGTQTFTGSKTFSGGVSIPNGYYPTNRSNNGTNITEATAKIQTGWAVITAGGSSPTVSQTITFPVAFTNLPIVVLTPGGDAVSGSTSYGNGNNSIQANQSGKAVAVTTTNFAAYVDSRSGNYTLGQEVFVQWIAIGI